MIIYHSTGQYQLGWRYHHTTAVVGEVLYCWGGTREGFDWSHDSPIKRQCTSAIDAFNLLSGVWSSQPARGTPPLGIIGVSCTTINNNIYYFGGWCGHGTCYHNSLNCLDTLTLQWKELQSTNNNSVTKRGYGGMIVMGREGEPQQLLVIGGMASISTITVHSISINLNTKRYLVGMILELMNRISTTCPVVSDSLNPRLNQSYCGVK